MEITKLAKELNQVIRECNETVYQMLSGFGKRVYFPKGIISQSAEAKKKAIMFNATVGIAKENKKAMMLDSFPDFISDKIDSQKILPYAPSEGLASLRDAWQTHQKKMNPNLSVSTLPIVTSGLTHGLSLVGELFLDESKNESLVMPELHWGNYKLMWQIKKRAKLITYPIFKESLAGFNMDSFKVAVEKSYGESDKTFLLFNFPHNPTGYSLSLEEAKNIEIYLLEQAEKGRRFVAVCDDAYWGLCYEKGTQKESLFSTLSKLHKNILAVKIDGCTKEFFMWGLRVGFISFGFKGMNDACAKALEKKTAAAIRANISNATHHSQEILVQLLASPKIYEEKKKKEVILRSRYEEVKEIVYNERFKNIWQAYPFNAGYFMCLHLKNGVKAEELRVKLLDSYGTGIISLSDHDIRITFSCIEKEGLVKFFSNLASAIEEL